MKIRVTIARTTKSRYAAYTTSFPTFFFEHEDLKALLQCVDNTISFYNEFGDDLIEGPDYWFSPDKVNFEELT